VNSELGFRIGRGNALGVQFACKSQDTSRGAFEMTKAACKTAPGAKFDAAALENK
jgi:hypothetical protein